MQKTGAKTGVGTANHHTRDLVVLVETAKTEAAKSEGTHNLQVEIRADALQKTGVESTAKIEVEINLDAIE